MKVQSGTRIEAAWNAIDVLRDFRPEARAHPDPDLLAGRRFPRFGLFPKLVAVAGLTAAAMLAVIFWWPTAPREAPLPTRQTIIRPGPERLTLGDGSVVELNRGAQVEVRLWSRKSSEWLSQTG
jgi:transmembrane sensor